MPLFSSRERSSRGVSTAALRCRVTLLLSFVSEISPPSLSVFAVDLSRYSFGLEGRLVMVLSHPPSTHPLLLLQVPSSWPLDGACHYRELREAAGRSRLDDDVLCPARGATIEKPVVFFLQLTSLRRTCFAFVGRAARQFDLEEDFRAIETNYRPHSIHPPLFSPGRAR